MDHDIEADKSPSGLEFPGDLKGRVVLACCWDEIPPLRRLRSVLGMLVGLCLVLAAAVWWQLLQDLP
jgi:hypothetical protein